MGDGEGAVGLSTELRSLIRAASGVRELGMMRACVRDRLEALGEERAAPLLEALFVAALRAARDRGEAALGAALWLASLHAPTGEARRAALHRASVDQGLGLLAALLQRRSPRRALAPAGRLPEVGLSWTAPVAYRYVAPGLAAGEGPVGLTALTRREHVTLRDRKGIQARRVRHPDPRFVRRLLADADTSERDAVAIAARRPTTSGIVHALVESRHIGSARVRRSITENPFTPFGVQGALMLTLGRDTARLIAVDGSPAARALAAQLLAIREAR